MNKKTTKKTKAVAIRQPPAPVEAISLPEKLEQVLVSGNLAVLEPEDRVKYYKAVCKSTGLNPLTKPFEYIMLNNKLILYARKDCTDQLRKIHGVSVYDYRTERQENVFIYTAFVQDKIGRKDIGTGVVTIGGLKGDALANAIMKAETKAKRRGTLSLCGLGMLDETELETITELPQAKEQQANVPGYQEPRKVNDPAFDKVYESMNKLYGVLLAEAKIKKGIASLEQCAKIRERVLELKETKDAAALQSMFDEWKAAYNERNQA